MHILSHNIWRTGVLTRDDELLIQEVELLADEFLSDLEENMKRFYLLKRTSHGL